ncbi:hypothetical protein PLUA15_320012 [Pseudomonas lundensis]|uniref:Secreted protein n=1 Tax=Pseudomonas lundensis TaxID=86185 RepID=A0AAX2HCP0_9PSED|nr:hypothetical protein PLUA15_320012 [Pseudomonas lundensis]
MVGSLWYASLFIRCVCLLSTLLRVGVVENNRSLNLKPKPATWVTTTQSAHVTRQGPWRASV